MRFGRVIALVLLPVVLSACGGAEPSHPLATAPAAPSLKPSVPPAPRFVNAAPDAGLTALLYCGGVSKDHLLESTGTGAALIDYDGDGRLDAFLVNAWALDEEPSRVRVKGRNFLYHNLGGGRFEDVTDRAGVGGDGWGGGVCAADYDDDGRIDIFVTGFGRCRLYRNRGDGTFEQVAERAGVASPGWSAGAAFFDADGDRDLDLYVAHYIDATFDEVLAARRTSTWREKVKVMAGPFGLRGGKDRFFRNNGDGTFRDDTEKAGMADLAESYGLGVLASDLDNDGDVDIYVTNDSNPKFLYRNDGAGSFTEIGSWSGAGLSSEGVAQAGMGVDAADFDGDGLQDIFVTNFARDHATFYKNNGNLLFSDISTTMRLKTLTYETLKWGCAFFDYDNDGDLDIVIANGHIYPQVDQAPALKESYRQLPTLLETNGGKLTDVSRTAGPGMQEMVSARGLAVGDYDDDGDLDLLLSVIDGPPLLLRNDTARSGHWLKVRPLNRHGSPALNARVTVITGNVRQLRELRSGSSYQSQNALELHFGTGKSTMIDTLKVVWPDGRESELHGVEADRTVTVGEPG
jgi:enediyne biosynthesis protein E4